MRPTGLDATLQRVRLLPFDEYVQSLDRKHISAGVLIRGARRRVLLVETSYTPHWDIPGGAVDAGESPWHAAKREVEEELGLARPIGRPLVIDFVPGDGRMPERLAFIFDGGLLSDDERRALVITDPEIRSVEMCTLAESAVRVKPVLARRLTAALDVAQTERDVALCHDGTRV
jgi:8-oxo-dGTP pyrophosphatase MutT (NUDIX family)